MTENTVSSQRSAAADLVTIAVVMGLASGLMQGLVHVGLQQLNFLEHVWYQILWIEPVFNGLLLLVTGLILAAALSRFGTHAGARRFSIFILSLVALLPVIVLALKEWVASYALLILAVGLSVAAARWFARNEAAGLRFFRRSLRPLVAITLLVFVAVQGGFWWRARMTLANLPAAADSAPDVVLIVLDALRADHLSTYGYTRKTSPAIDRLAEGGVLFEQAYSTSSYTLPAHASLLTGLYPNEHQVEWGTAKTYKTAAYPTLPETLANRGYRTGAFSGNTFWFTRAQGFGRGFLHFDDFFSSVGDMVLRTTYGRTVTRVLQHARIGFEDIPARKRAPETNRAVLDWLNQAAGRPSLVVINYMDVHDPYMPPQPYRSKFSTQANPGGLIHWELHIPKSLTVDQLQGEVDAYDGAINFVDTHVGELIEALQARRGRRELIVFITSDHGEEFGEHGGLLHGHHLYRETIQVPLIVWASKGLPAGTRVSQPVTTAAIPATIMNLLASGDQTFPGPPLLSPSSAFPLAQLKRRPWAPKDQPVSDGAMRSIVSHPWHYIEHDTRGSQLFDLVNDPREAKDLAKDPAMRAVIDQLRKHLVRGDAVPPQSR